MSLHSAVLASHLPTLKPRRYSVASSPGTRAKEAASLSLVVGVVRYHTPSHRPKQGLATSQLATLQPGTSLLAALRATHTFKLPRDPALPVIMICAGWVWGVVLSTDVLLTVLPRSGIAPFRGFWCRRSEQRGAGWEVGPTLLYFGCRRRTMNLLTRETQKLAKSKNR